MSSRRVCLRLALLAGLVFAAGAHSQAHAALGDFASAGEFEVGTTPFDIAAGDFNDDGVIDVVTPNANSADLSVLLGDGDGTFTEARRSPISVGQVPKGVATGDVNGDGIDDIAATQGAESGSVHIFLSNGNGKFTVATPVAVGANPDKLALGSFNADSNLDLAVVNGTYSADNGTLSVLLGNGAGGFTAAPGSPVTVGQFPSDVVAGNLSSDSNVDLAVSNTGGDSITILLGSSTGAFTVAGTEMAGDGPDNMAIAELNGDGRNDLAVGNAFSENVSILLGSDTGDFTAAATSPEPEGDGWVTLGEFTGDAHIDLAAPEWTDKVHVLANDGAASFSPLSSSPEIVLGLVTHLTHGDTDGDGDNDLLVAGGNGDLYAVTSLLNNEPNQDEDGFVDAADECPTVPGPVLGCPINFATMTVAYKPGAQKFKGKVTSTAPHCAGPGRKVTVSRLKNPDIEVKLGTAKTNAKGKWRFAQPVKRGRFRATTPRTIDPVLGICERSFTDTISVPEPE